MGQDASKDIVAEHFTLFGYKRPAYLGVTRRFLSLRELDANSYTDQVALLSGATSIRFDYGKRHSLRFASLQRPHASFLLRRHLVLARKEGETKFTEKNQFFFFDVNEATERDKAKEVSREQLDRLMLETKSGVASKLAAETPTAADSVRHVAHSMESSEFDPAQYNFLEEIKCDGGIHLKLWSQICWHRDYAAESRGTST